MAGELDFVDSFTARLALLKGLPETHLEAIADRLRLMPGATILLENLTALGVRCGILSGGFHYFAERIGARLGMDFVVSNTLECADGAITGAVVPPVIDGSAKVETLVRERDRMGLDVEQTLAVGDGANDIPMLQAAGIGVAFRGKPKVVASTPHRLTHCDLSALAYLLV
jgi:phosphoserine phosphatase